MQSASGSDASGCGKSTALRRMPATGRRKPAGMAERASQNLVEARKEIDRLRQRLDALPQEKFQHPAAGNARPIAALDLLRPMRLSLRRIEQYGKGDEATAPIDKTAQPAAAGDAIATAPAVTHKGAGLRSRALVSGSKVRNWHPTTTELHRLPSAQGPASLRQALGIACRALRARECRRPARKNAGR
jgi:hypothetical protein